MAYTRVQILAQVDYIISADDDELSAAARNEMIKAAIEQYSHDMPDVITEDEAGDGGKYYALTGLASWSEGFSQIISIQYPAPTVASDEAPVYLDPDDWDADYWAGSPSVRYLYLPNHAPAATETMRIRYTAPYTAGASGYDIPSAHFYAVCNLAASLCARAIANKYSRSNDSTIVADSVNHMTRANEWSRRARELFQAYLDELNIAGSGPAGGAAGGPAGKFVDWDTRPSGSGRWLYH